MSNSLSKKSTSGKSTPAQAVPTSTVIAVIVVVLIVIVSFGYIYAHRSHRKPPPPQLTNRPTNPQGQLIVPGAGRPK